ncbi:hypothetical protein U8C31_21130 [Sinorhizobium medicae]|uniref:hypothetical protein n=1 Tax=Sinorhizobium medicae TaxID=110321 RepID=UPI002AF6B88A|nr:hypothetical protein [Sinorhizobium medicae]WQO72702.1 hypothetical protein U8C31_21130 [Sinorhizobium medicae]
MRSVLYRPERMLFIHLPSDEAAGDGLDVLPEKLRETGREKTEGSTNSMGGLAV